MSYAQALLGEANTWAAAYIQYETGRLREGFRAYAFVEDNDDKSFYQLALSNVDHICYLGCGGKSGVFAIFNKLNSEDKSDGNLFFVDRDTETSPFMHADDILRTEMYSWESYVCIPEYVGWFLQRRLEPNPSPEEINLIICKWRSSIRNFKDALNIHLALCRTALVLEKSLGVGDFSITTGAVSNANELHPSPDAVERFASILQLAIQHGATEADVKRRREIFANLDLIKYSHGKILFQILRKFVQFVITDFGKEIRGAYNSPKFWLEAMPWTDSNLEYIREYANRRIRIID